MINVQPRKSRVTFARSKGISSEPVYVKKASKGPGTHDKDDKRLHNINSSSDPASSGREDNYGLNPAIFDTVRSQNARKVFAPVVFNPNSNSSAPSTVQGKVDTDATVSCMPVSMLSQIGLSSNDLTLNRSFICGISGADFQNCWTVDINVTCNNITTKTRFYVTKHDYALILGLEFCKTFRSEGNISWHIRRRSRFVWRRGPSESFAWSATCPATSPSCTSECHARPEGRIRQNRARNYSTLLKANRLGAQSCGCRTTSTPRGDTGRTSLTKKARFLQRLILHSRNTVSYVYHLGSRCPQRSFASEWIASCQAFLEHFRAQTMLKYKDLRKSAMTSTSWRRSRKHIKPDWNSTPKSVIKKQEIEYFGRVISHQGVTPCPKKVKAILSPVASSDKQELQSLLGTVNFMAAFIPNLTKKTFLMRSLLKRDAGGFRPHKRRHRQRRPTHPLWSKKTSDHQDRRIPEMFWRSLGWRPQATANNLLEADQIGTVTVTENASSPFRLQCPSQVCRFQKRFICWYPF